jgi:hypothetical protein
MYLAGPGSDVDESDAASRDVFHERFHAHTKLNRRRLWGEQRFGK